MLLTYGRKKGRPRLVSCDNVSVYQLNAAGRGDAWVIVYLNEGLYKRTKKTCPVPLFQSLYEMNSTGGR